MNAPVHPDWARAGGDWPNREASDFVQVGPVRWHYQRMGSGPVLVLLHGAGAATHSWRDLLPLLAEHFDVIAPDLPRHGFTRTQARQQCALPAMAEAVTALLAHLRVRPAVMVGHSAGAAIALETVLSGQLEPDRVIGLNAALTPFRGMAGVVFPPLAKALALNPFVPWVFSGFASGAAQVRKLIDGTGSRIDARGLELYGRMVRRPDHVDGALAMMALWDLNPLLARLSKLETPVDLVVGMGDRTVDPQEAIRLSEQVPAIHLHRVDGLGHLMHEEAPEQFSEMIGSLAT